MPSLLRSLLPARQPARSISTVDDYLDALSGLGYYGGLDYSGLTGTWGHQAAERIPNDLEGFARNAYGQNSIVFGCMSLRMSVFSTVRFAWQRLNAGRPSDLFGTRALELLERPWPGGTTQDLLARIIQDADLAGNAYWTVQGGQLVRLRPDWVQIVMAPRAMRGGQVGWDKLGYAYWEDGIGVAKDPVAFLVDEVAHFAPSPDPLASYRGMSWLTPILREISNDKAMVLHQQKYFENAAVPSLSVSLDKDIRHEAFLKFKEAMNENHRGLHNSYKTLFLGGGADVKVIGSDLQQLDFKRVQGAGEPLALDTPIPTPTGWTTMGEIRPGDQVFGRNGRPAAVTAVSPVRVDRDCFRITLKDRTAIVADAGHLWVAVDRQTTRRAERTYTTEQLFEIITQPHNNGVGGHRLSLPRTPIVELPPLDLLVDPYVLGAWLGDGQTAGAAITGAPEDLKYICAEIERRGYTVSQWKTASNEAAVIGIPGGLLAALDALGVLGDKKIPQNYLRASVEQRLDLLRGLMDTGGTVDYRGRGSCSFSSKWEGLARQFAELTRSLGYRTTVSVKADSRSRTGRHWNVLFRAEQDRIPFLLPRKVDACVAAGDPHVASRSIVSIERVDSVPVRCITVDTEDHLFLAGEGFTPTHNSRIAAAAGVPPMLVGLAEGMRNTNQAMYSAARRRFADGTMHPLWANVVGSLAPLIAGPPPGAPARLWFDTRDVPFLREDRTDAAEILRVQAGVVRTLIEAGYEPDSVVKAVSAEDLDLLIGAHSGLTSVQLQPPLDEPGEIKPIKSSAPKSEPEDEPSGGAGKEFGEDDDEEEGDY